MKTHLLWGCVFAALACQAGAETSEDAGEDAGVDAATDSVELPPDGSIASEEEIIESGDAQLYVRRVGDPKAPTLITINGGPGISSHYMDSLEELAGADLAVVFYDQRGIGRSSESPASGYALDRYVEDLDAVVTWTGASSVHMFGHSWGGFLALMYAVAYPDRIASLLLLGSMPPDSGSFSEGQQHLQARIAELQEKGVIPETLPDDFCAQTIAIAPAYFFDPMFSLPKEFGEVDCDETVAYGTFEKLGFYDRRKDVAGILGPVLVLWGEGDGFGLPMRDATLDALDAADVTAETLPECGHLWQECPEDFFAPVRMFLGL